MGDCTCGSSPCPLPRICPSKDALGSLRETLKHLPLSLPRELLVILEDLTRPCFLPEAFLYSTLPHAAPIFPAPPPARTVLQTGTGPVLGEGSVKARTAGVFGEHEERVTCGPEDPWVTEAVASSEGLHHAVNLLGLTGQPETPQELPRGPGPWSEKRVGPSVAPGSALPPSLRTGTRDLL